MITSGFCKSAREDKEKYRGAVIKSVRARAQQPQKNMLGKSCIVLAILYVPMLPQVSMAK